ncbi:sensor histidine kinase [Paenibacillus sp. FSL H8-0548]|uniref:sensor histidine kinase n=1 Tax=Paenibacillus sp. FSL H8-0548 TaxID=1920422 RepID=UPI00096FD688|nr:histidine kinase [Paenibacillus sp. FSL H8-0548]OMF30794.1 sensor histidine kinase [Paenibacillus sp. FSL H8-0548]
MKLNFVLDRYRQFTFKNRIITIFTLSILIPFVCLGLVSLFAINSILANQVQGSIQSSLRQEILALENTLNNLNHVSQQLVFGSTNRLLEQLQHESDPFERLRLRNQLKSELNVITFSNPNIGLTLYYFENTKEYDFENFFVREQFNPEQLPVMEIYPEVVYFGPHKSNNRSVNQLVFSTMRKVDLPEQDVYVYIETGFNAVKKLFDTESPENKSRRLLILDNEGKIKFSQEQNNFPLDSLFPLKDSVEMSGVYGQYVWNKETSNQGWSIVSILPKEELNREKNQWFFRITIYFLFFELAAIFIALLLSRMVYKPLERFNMEIKSLVQSNSKDNTDLTNIPEFDYLLYKIRKMKIKIWDLYGEIERKEKRRADLEVEKLLYQINPHFLMNTLDTVHWLAMMNGQEEIDKLALSLNKLLQYNLGKMGEETTIRGEIEALKEYLQLQKIRYDFQFDVDIDVDDDAMLLPIPRFILQPLVENALYHGVSDDGYIHVDIRLNDELQITIQDNGSGMLPEKIDQLLNDDSMDSQKVGMGIGMKYVKRILEANYGNQATFHIKSEIGNGTIISLSLPVLRGEQKS